MSRRERIREKVLARVLIDEMTGCWVWQGPDSGTGRGGGYPRMSLDGGTVAVHKVMWIIENGPVPPRKQLDHECVQRMCVNPIHIQLVTHKRNQILRAARARAFQCEEVRA
jgi:hypothetical protein